MSSTQPMKFEYFRHGTEVWGFKITEGRWTDTTILINQISDNLEDPLGGITLDYQVLTVTQGMDHEGRDKAEFESVLNDVLTETLSRAVEYVKQSQEYETRNTNTE